MKKHFTTDNKTTWVQTVLMFLSVPIFMSGFWLFYEYWGQPKYWKNRWRLHRLIKANKVKVISKNDGGKITRYNIKIEGSEYELDIWQTNGFAGRSDEMTLGMIGESYIGLFKGSLITKWLNKRAIKSIRELSDPAFERERKLKILGII
jgi:hypothetical protein